MIAVLELVHKMCPPPEPIVAQKRFGAKNDNSKQSNGMTTSPESESNNDPQSAL
jgi:hypothetical protein